MKKLLALEEFAQILAVAYVFTQLDTPYNYLLLIFLFFLPDLFAIGYFVSKRVGAAMYNFSHHKFVAVALFFIGILLLSHNMIAAGLMAYAHSSFDRLLGYGLKYVDSPNHTHLGFIGKEKFKNVDDHF